MWRRVWKPLAAVAVVGTPPAYFYYRHYVLDNFFELPVKVQGPDGKPEMVTKTFRRLPLDVLEARIRQHATFQSHSRPGGIVWKHTTADLASNDPIEDAHASQIVERDPTDPSYPGDYLFFAVMDGHGGYETSRLLSRVIIKAVALELSHLTNQPPLAKPGYFGSARALTSQTPLDADPQKVSLTIQHAFTKLDDELLAAPLHVLANNVDEESRKKNVIPDLSQHPLALATMLPAISGSCALMAVFDTAHRDLYVACTGDSRAVAGVWETTPDGEGRWRVEVLSEDQTGRNPSELARMQFEHPKDEENDVIRRGRVLGGLEPSRAFGDARYKWSRKIQETLNQAFLAGNGTPIRTAPALFKTPPYVIARPVVTHRKLSFPSDESTANPIRFLVLATDGLWDRLSNDEVVSLVGGHLAGYKGKISKPDLQTLFPTSSGSMGVQGKDKTDKQQQGSWAFLDENVSAHLIRNAFGGGNENYLRNLLSITAPYARRHRDDVTVTVVWWEDGKEEAARVVTEKVKSKL